MVEDRFRQILYDFSDEEPDAGSESSERTGRIVDRNDRP